MGCFVAWVIYGLSLRRSAGQLAQSWAALSPAARTSRAAIYLVTGLVLLGVGLALLPIFRLISPDGLTPLGILVVLLSGLAFTRFQVLAALCLALSVIHRPTETAPSTDSSNQDTVTPS